MKKRIISLLAAAAMCMGLLPSTVFATEETDEGNIFTLTKYDIWVGGIQVTSDNKNDVLGEADGDGATVAYNAESSTLTLDGATITGAARSGHTTDNYNGYGYGIWADGDLKIVVASDSAVTGADVPAKNSYGVWVGGALTISGEGVLTATGGETNFESFGVYSGGTLTNSGKLTANGGTGSNSGGVLSGNGLTNDGTLTAIGGKGDYESYGVNCKGNLINRGTLTATGNGDTNYSIGIYIFSLSGTQTNSSNLTAIGKTNALNKTFAKSSMTPTIVAGMNIDGTGATKVGLGDLPGEYKYVKITTDGGTSDTTAPTLSAGGVTRTGDTAATVKFTSNEAGQYYYDVVDAGADAPTIDTTAAGTACDTAEQTITLDSLTAGAKDIYTVVKDAAGNVSDALKITIPAYVPATINYNIWVTGVRVTSDNATDVLGEADGDGATVIYTADSNILTLTGANISGVVDEDSSNTIDDGYGYGIYTADNLVIKVTTDSSVTAAGVSDSKGSYGIYAKKKLSISGDGTLTATGGAVGAGGLSAGVYCGTLTNGSALNANGSSYGVYCAYDLIVSDGTLNAIGGKTGVSCTFGNITINDGALNATGTQYSGVDCAIDFTINGGSLTATGGAKALNQKIPKAGNGVSLSIEAGSDSGNITANTYTDEKYVHITTGIVELYTAELNSSGLSGATAELNKTIGISAGDTVTLTITPNEGYRFSATPVVSANNANVGLVTAGDNGVYTCQISGFTANVIITVTGTAAAASPETTSIVVTTAADVEDSQDGLISLREAITMAAENSDTAHTITFASDVTKITLTSPLTIQSSAFGGGNPLTINGMGKVTIDGNNTTTIIKGRIMYIDYFNVVTLKGLTLQNGYCFAENGGAIYNRGTLTAEGCTFTGNKADSYGGAVYNVNGGTLTATNCVFTDNTAGSYGGAVYNVGESTLTATNCTFTGNTASYGGAVYNHGTLTVTNCAFAGNTTDNYGGAIDNRGTLAAANCVFTGNKASYGGAVENSKTLAAANCTFTGNEASYGGAVDNYGTLTAANCTFTGNKADSYGGAINNSSQGSAYLVNSILVGNTAPQGGDVYTSKDHSTYAYYCLVGVALHENNNTDLDALSGTGTAIVTVANVFASVDGTGAAVADSNGLFSIKTGGAADGKGVFVWHNANRTALAYSVTKEGAKTAVLGSVDDTNTMLSVDQRGTTIGDTADVGAVLAGGTSDTTAPSLTAGEVNRTGDTAATVKFTSNEAGQYYYDVVDAGATPEINTTEAGTACGTTEQTITLDSLTAGAKDIYIVVMDASGNVSSSTFKITIPAYVPVISYDVWVGDVQVTSANMNDVLDGDTTNGGKVSYAPATAEIPAKLKLNGAVVAGSSVAAIKTTAPLDIEITDDVTLNGRINAHDQPVNITGSGSLTITPSTDSSVEASSFDIELTGSITVSGCFMKGVKRMVSKAGSISVTNGTSGAIPISCVSNEAVEIRAAGDITIKSNAQNAALSGGGSNSTVTAGGTIAITNGGGYPAISSAYNLTAQKLSFTLKGQTVTLDAGTGRTVTCSGQMDTGMLSDNVSYRWYNHTDTSDADGVEISNATGAAYAPAEAGYYSCLFSDGSYSGRTPIMQVSAPRDTTAPNLTAGEVNRTSDTAATVKFTSDEAGQYYYVVVNEGADVPTIGTTAAGTACGTAEQTITLDSLTAGAKDIYIVVKDAADNVSSSTFKITIPAYVPKTTKYDIWVAGVRVTSDNAADVLGDADGNKVTVAYDAATNTLTLDGYQFNNGNYYIIPNSTTGDRYYALYAEGAPLTIVLADGSVNTFTQTTALPDSINVGMLCIDEGLTIRGKGKLTVDVEAQSTGSESSTSVTSVTAFGGLTVKGGAKVDIQADYYCNGAGCGDGLYNTAAVDVSENSSLSVSGADRGWYSGNGNQNPVVSVEVGSSFTVTGGTTAIKASPVNLSTGVKMAGATSATAALQPVSYSGNDTTYLLPDGSVAKYIAFQTTTATMSETAKTVYIPTGGGDQSIDLATLFPAVEAPVFGTPTVANGGEFEITTPTVSGGVLTFTSHGGNEGKKITITIPVTSFSHLEFTATLTVTLMDKTPVTITGVEAATGLVYNGSTQKGYTGTATASGYTGTFVYSYEGISGTTYGPVADAPVNAGSYRLTISVPENDATYTGSTSVEFTIDKATPTGTANYTILDRKGALRKANLNVGTIVPAEGSINWVTDPTAGNEQILDIWATYAELDETYYWRFKPTDQNYKNLYGRVVLWPSETTAPTLTAGYATRTSDTTATVKFTSNEAGQYYYVVVNEGADALTIDTTAAGTACDTTEQTITLDSLTAGSKDIYIVVMDASGNVSSDTFKIVIPAYEPATVTPVTASYDKYTATEGITFTLTPGAHTLTAIKNGTAALTSGTDYTVSGNRYTITESYLDKQAEGSLTLTFDMNGGTDPTVTITISDNTPTGHIHSWGAWTKLDSTRHQRVCTTDPSHVEKANHSFGSDRTCDVCGYTKPGSGGGGGGGVSYTYYTITASAGKGGEILSDGNASVREDSNRTFTIIPENGYVIDDVLVDGKSVGAVDSYTFEDVSEKHTIEAVFKEATHDNTQTEVDMDFEDVAETDWFYESVVYVYNNGLMSGTGAATFDPHSATTRAMVAMMLWRMEGSPEVEGMYADYADVAQGSWYENAIGWAAKNGILSGYGGGFMGPQDAVTREQMAVILMNYAKLMGYDTTAAADLSKFSDNGKISAYAVNGLAWANANGLINGRGNGILDPAGMATRCEVAAIIYNFCENIMK